MNILLVPGFMLDADLWTEIRRDLAEYATVTDVDTTRDDSIEAMASRAVAGLNTPSFVLGFSMGGYVAREIAYQGSNLVRGLILVATSARGRAPVQATLTEGPEFRRLSRAAVARSLHPAKQTNATVSRVQEMSARLGPDVFARQSKLNRAGDLERLGEIQCPTLVVAAAEDQLRSEAESRELRDGISGASLEVIQRSGHLIPLEQPEQLSRLVLAFCKAHA